MMSNTYISKDGEGMASIGEWMEHKRGGLASVIVIILGWSQGVDS